MPRRQGDSAPPCAAPTPRWYRSGPSEIHLPPVVRDALEVGIVSNIRHREEQVFDGSAVLRGQQGPAQDLPVFRLRRAAMTRGGHLEGANDLLFDVPHDQLPSTCHPRHAINDSTLQ